MGPKTTGGGTVQVMTIMTTEREGEVFYELDMFPEGCQNNIHMYWTSNDTNNIPNMMPRGQRKDVADNAIPKFTVICWRDPVDSLELVVVSVVVQEYHTSLLKKILKSSLLGGVAGLHNSQNLGSAFGQLTLQFSLPEDVLNLSPKFS